MCGRTEMKDNIRRNETDVPAIWWIQHGVGEDETSKEQALSTGPTDQTAGYLVSVKSIR